MKGIQHFFHQISWVGEATLRPFPQFVVAQIGDLVVADVAQFNLNKLDNFSPVVFVHHSTANTFITSSPRWLITFTAIRPDFGFANGRDTSEFNVSHASSSISAFSVVFSAL